MKGTWVYDEKADTWHLGWDHTRNEPARGNDIQSSWCRKGFELTTPTKRGELISFMDICHDECVRKSEELG